MSLTLEEIRERGRRVNKRAVPFLDGEATVRTMSSERRDDYHLAYRKARGDSDGDGMPRNFRALLVAFALCDDAGSYLAAGPDDAERAARDLAEVDGIALDAVFDAAAELNAIRQKDIKGLEKNSETSLNSSSSSGSPNISE